MNMGLWKYLIFKLLNNKIIKITEKNNNGN